MRTRWGDQKKTDHLEEQSIDGRKIQEQILKKYDGESVDLTDVTQDSEKWWDFVNTVMNICVL
jgi:hypothetical protein